MVSVRMGVLAAGVMALTLGGCGTVRKITGNNNAMQDPSSSALFKNGGGGDANLGVNGFLWRASLDTLSFMPLVSADPWGGTIITDWYSNPEQPGERFKVTVYILDTRLRADGLKVTVFKETRGVGGGWVSSNVAGQTESDIQNAILTRARQLRLSNVRN